MNPEQQKSILTIALYAAFADGASTTASARRFVGLPIPRANQKGSRAQASPGAAGDSSPRTGCGRPLAPLQDVLLKRVSLDAAAAALQDSGERQLAYEMAVCVCDADGRQSEAEQRFLNELKSLLKLDAGQAAAFEREADVIVELSEAAAPAVVAGAALRPARWWRRSERGRGGAGQVHSQLRPDEWRTGAAAAVVGVDGDHPLQIKMVYGIGKAHGVQLDQGHIKEFIAAAGVGSLRNISNSSAASCWRPARQGRRQDLRQDRRRGHRHGLFLRHHLCTGQLAKRYYAAAA